MNVWLPLARRWLALPAPRHRTEEATEWVALADGTRLATTLIRPVGTEPRGAVLLRTPDGPIAPLQMPFLLGRFLAERGSVVIVQECRGRGRSEGRFEPFRHEAEDGAEAITWLTAQAWFPGRLALVGFGYAGYAAWAGLAAARAEVAALVAGFAGRDPHATLYTGGALQLELALSSLAMGDREPVTTGVDLDRGARHRPVREADRITDRRWDPYREWVDHPEPGDYWRERTPALPKKPPATLLIGGFHHPALEAQLRDFEALAAAEGGGAAAPELLVGPWGMSVDLRRRGGGPFAAAARATGDFLDRHLLGEGRLRRAPVRVFVQAAERWREGATWPLPAEERIWHLRSDGGANAADGDGRLDAAAPGPSEPADHFVYDPADAVPTCGGPVVSGPAGLADAREIEGRADVLCYTSDPLAVDLEIAGPVGVVLHVETDAPATDFTARLVAVAPDGAARSVCDGIARCHEGGETPGGARRVEIACSSTAFRFRSGECLRVEVSSSNFPRFDRNPNTAVAPGAATEQDCRPARQTIHHDAERPSTLCLRVVPF